MKTVRVLVGPLDSATIGKIKTGSRKRRLQAVREKILTQDLIQIAPPRPRLPEWARKPARISNRSIA